MDGWKDVAVSEMVIVTRAAESASGTGVGMSPPGGRDSREKYTPVLGLKVQGLGFGIEG